MVQRRDPARGPDLLQDQSCTLLRQSHLPVRAASARLARTGRTSKVIATRRHLLCLLGWLTDRSRAPSPEGSLPAFAWGDVARRLNPYPPDYRAAFASSLTRYPQPHRLALRLTFPRGRATGLPCSAPIPERVRSRLSAGGATSAAGER